MGKNGFQTATRLQRDESEIINVINEKKC